MLYLGFDTETTDKADFRAPANADHQPDLVQLAARVYDEEKNYAHFKLYVVPEKPISDGAFNTHGIDAETAKKQGVPRRVALAMFFNFLKITDTLVAHNLNFDMRILMTALAREGIDNGLLLMKLQYCTMLTATNVCKLPGQIAGKYKWPSLQEAYKILVDQQGFVDAHDAMVDVDACIAIHRSLMKLAKEAA